VSVSTDLSDALYLAHDRLRPHLDEGPAGVLLVSHSATVRGNRAEASPAFNSELDKREDDLRAEAGTILAELIDWAEVQFRAMGREDAKELGVALIAAYEGIALLAATLRDPGLISTEGDRLNRWIDSLSETHG
jgi:hypothetical protein